MTISLNGEPADAREAKTIAELIDRYELPRQSVLVEQMAQPCIGMNGQSDY